MTDVAERPGAEAPPAEGPDLGVLFGELREESRLLIRHEIDLAKAEISEARGHLLTGVIGFAAAAVLALLAVVLLSLAAAWGLDEVWPTWLAFLAVGGAWVVLALVAVLVGRGAFSRFDPIPRRTIQTLKEDARWVRTLTN